MSLVTSDFVTDMSLVTADFVSDVNTLATTDIVNDLNLLATSDFVSDLNTLATSDFVSDLNALEAIKADVTTVAGNITNVSNFANRYRIASSDPSDSLDAGDLVFNTSSNVLKVYNGSAWLEIDNSPSVVTIADESSDTTCFPLFATAATGDVQPKSGSNLTFNSSSGALTATSFVGNVTGNASGSSGSCTGNAATATALETARNIGGVSFDGTGNIDLPGVNSAGNQNTSGTAAIATAVTVADESSDTTCFPLFSTAATGDLGPKSGSNLTFNSSSGTLGATVFSGSGSSLTGVVIETASTGSAEIPVGTTAQRDGSPATGMFRFNSTTTGFEGYNGSAWGSIGGGASAGGAIYENKDDVTTNHTIASGSNGFSVGPMTIASGVTVTISSGQRWLIL
jgi:hypothetical protein